MKIKRTLRHEQLLVYGCTGALSCLFGFLLVNTLAPINLSDAADTFVEVNALVNPIISLNVDTNSLNYSLTPTANAVFESKKVTATVATNSNSGYELYFSSADNANSMTSLLTDGAIASDFNSSVTSSAMASNKWGYSTDNSSFSKIPLLSSQAELKNINHVPSSAEKVTDVYVGIKVDSSLPSGTYTKNVVFTAVAHPNAEPTLNDLTYMQDMTTAICNATTTGATKTLTDSRDSNTYTVYKSADGKCWMGENLALEGTTSGDPLILTAANSDVASSFTMPAASNAWTSTFDDPVIYQTNGVHYYNFAAASAGTVTGETSTDSATSSICPRGWKMPSYTDYVDFLSDNEITSDAAGYAEITSTPYNFAPVGYMSYGTNPVFSDTVGEYMASTYSYTADTRSVLYIGNNTVLAGESGLRREYGMPLRCVSK